MRFGISNLVVGSLSAECKSSVLRFSEVCDFAPTALYGDWQDVPDPLPVRPYGPEGPVISALQSLFFGCSDISLVREEAAFRGLVKHFERVAALAEKSGVPCLVFGSPGVRSRRMPAITDEQLEARVGKLADIAFSHGVKLCFEVNSAKFGCEYLNQNAALIELLKSLHHPGLGLHLDIGQMLEEGLDVPEYLEDKCESLLHLHLSAPDFTFQSELSELYIDIVEQLRIGGARADIILEVQKIDKSLEKEFLNTCGILANEVTK